MSKPERRLLAQEWISSAESDFQYATVGLKQRIIFPQVAFLSQQVAEKYLKGYLMFHGKVFPRIHDLTKLLDVCVRIEPELEKLRNSCELLTGFYIETRYPPDIPDYTKEEINKAYVAAKRIKEQIETVSQPRS
ncbi:HEPN domain-containing protein [Candidatus Roizmanbacteria bacterium]|nr:HEPN domain-containing protein [Candidatus Roizmanbacteria bacterium]